MASCSKEREEIREAMFYMRVIPGSEGEPVSELRQTRIKRNALIRRGLYICPPTGYDGLFFTSNWRTLTYEEAVILYGIASMYPKDRSRWAYLYEDGRSGRVLKAEYRETRRRLREEAGAPLPAKG